MEKFELKGVWKGEYAYDDRFQPAVVKAAVPFMLKIRSMESNGFFEGMCQDDPSVSLFDFPADVYGKFDGNELIFSKRYPKTVFRDALGNIVRSDQPQPDVIYQANWSGNGKIFGSWKIERTFLKLGDKVTEVNSITGAWWMERF